MVQNTAPANRFHGNGACQSVNIPNRAVRVGECGRWGLPHNSHPILYVPPKHPPSHPGSIDEALTALPLAAAGQNTGRHQDVSSHTETHNSAPAVPETAQSVDGIEIENLRGIAGAREVERLQAEIWKANEGWLVPSHVLLIVSDYGGILLGARLEGQLVGFVLGFLARADNRLFHASHMLGVLPTSQHHGIGAALKWRQREVARSQGLDLMRWTFDPLEARNAHFNFHKLGTVCRSYRPDYYGAMPDALNRDLPSDRLVVEWRLNDGLAARDTRENSQPLVWGRNGLPELDPGAVETGRPVTIEVPTDLQALKRAAPEAALAWRLTVRRAFSVAFDGGYEAQDFRERAYVLVPGGEMTHES